MTRTIPFVKSGPYPFQNGGLPAMASGYGARIAPQDPTVEVVRHFRSAKKEPSVTAIQMPSVRGGSSKPSQQEQAVLETVTVESIPPVEDLSYMYTDSKPVSMPDMSLIEEPKKISPMTYAIGAAALLLGGWYFLRN